MRFYNKVRSRATNTLDLITVWISGWKTTRLLTLIM